MALLTDEQLHEIRELIRAHHSAFIANTIGPEAVAPEVLEQLSERGMIDVEIATIEDAYLYGHALAAADNPAVSKMSLEEFKQWVRRNPIPLTDQERRAIDFAKHQAAQYAVGLGNRVDTQTGQLLIEADRQLEQQRRSEIQTATAEAIAQRKSVKELVSDLKWKTQDWARDWDRIAVTEKHNAMQHGMADHYIKRYGDGVRVFKRPTPDACFIAGTLVTTGRGYVPIEEVQVNDSVLTHRGHWKHVRHTMRRHYEGDLFGFNGRNPYMTANHPVLVDLNWRRADAIECGAYLVQVTGIHISKNDPVPFLEKALLENVTRSSTPTSVPITSVQLNRYLQLRDSDVDVEFVDCHFRNGREVCEELTKAEGLRGSRRARSLSRFSFSALGSWLDSQLAGFARGFRKLLALSFGHSTQTSASAVGGCGQGNVVFHQAPFDDTTADTEVGSDGRHRVLSRIEKGLDLSERYGSAFHSHDFGVTSKLEIVNSIATEHFSGDVYNLEIEDDHSYVAENIVVHNCQHCKRLHLGPDGQPRIFKLRELERNGTNFGRKARDWLPVVGATHPHCFPAGTQVRTSGGMLPIESVLPGDMVLNRTGWSRITHVWASSYTGLMVTIETRHTTLQATANHPFLVGSEWVTANNLEVGQNLLRLNGVVGRSPAPPPHDDPAQGLKSGCLARVFSGCSGAGVPVTAIDFDGRLYLREGEVDQESLHLESGSGRGSQSQKSIEGFALVGTAKLTRRPSNSGEDELLGLTFTPNRSMEGGYIGQSLSFRHLGHTDCLGVGLSTLPMPRFIEAGYDGPAADSKLMRYRLDRQQLVEVERDNHGGIQFIGAGGHRHGDVVGEVSPIVNVTRCHYSGTVYNLTVSKTHEFTANDLVAHNCQCQLIRIPEGWGFDENGDLFPGGEFGVRYEGPEDLALALRQEDELRKAHKLQGHTEFQGIPIAIENRKGTVRRWVSESTGEQGETKMVYSYGYAKKTSGADGDEVDIYLGPDPRSSKVYVVHQFDGLVPGGRDDRYDEDKCFLGFTNQAMAERAYHDHMDDTSRFGSVTAMDIDHFKRWLGVTKPTPGHGLTFTLPIKPVQPDLFVMQKAGPFIGPRGGKWADVRHTIPWKEGAATVRVGRHTDSYPAPDWAKGRGDWDAEVYSFAGSAQARPLKTIQWEPVLNEGGNKNHWKMNLSGFDLRDRLKAAFTDIKAPSGYQVVFRVGTGGEKLDNRNAGNIDGVVDYLWHYMEAEEKGRGVVWPPNMTAYVVKLPKTFEKYQPFVRGKVSEHAMKADKLLAEFGRFFRVRDKRARNQDHLEKADWKGILRADPEQPVSTTAMVSAQTAILTGVRGGKIYGYDSKGKPIYSPGQKKPRTGAIPLHEASSKIGHAQVNRLVEELLTNTKVNAQGIIPGKPMAGETKVTIKTPTGQDIKITVSLEPKVIKDPRGISGFANTLQTKQHGRWVHEGTRVVLSPSDHTGQDRDTLAEKIRDVLSHELTHAVDPTIIKRSHREGSRKFETTKKRNYADYLNIKTEVTASIQQIGRDILDKRVTDKLIEQVKEHEADPTYPAPWDAEELLAMSRRWEMVGDYYTPANRKRVMKMVHQLREAIVSGQARGIVKSLRKAGFTGRGPALGSSGQIATEIGAQTSPAIYRAPGHGTMLNIVDGHTREAPPVHQDVIGYDPNSDKDPKRQRLYKDPDENVHVLGPRQETRAYEVDDQGYFRAGEPEVAGIRRTPIVDREPIDDRGPLINAGHMGSIETMLEAQDWDPDDDPGINVTSALGKLSDAEDVYSSLMQVRERPVFTIPEGIAPYTDAGHRATERAEVKRLEEHQVKNRQRPRNTVDVEDG